MAVSLENIRSLEGQIMVLCLNDIHIIGTLYEDIENNQFVISGRKSDTRFNWEDITEVDLEARMLTMITNTV